MIFGRADYDTHIGRLVEPITFIPIDEPVFLIRSRDSLGVSLVHAYARQLRQAASRGDTDYAIADHAEAHAAAMANYRGAKRLPGMSDLQVRGEIVLRHYTKDRYTGRNPLT